MTQLSNIFPTSYLPNWTQKIAAYTAIPGDFLLVNTTSAAITITLPLTPSINSAVNFSDPFNTWQTNALIVNGNGANIQGSNTVLTTDVSASFYLIYVGGTIGWKIFAGVSSIPGNTGGMGAPGNPTIPANATTGIVPSFSSTSGSLNDSGVPVGGEVLTVQSLSRTSYSFGSADLYKETRRLNGGVTMTDTLPASTTSGLINGTVCYINNSDPNLGTLLILSPGTGTTITLMTGTVSSVNIESGRSTKWIYDQANTTWRPVQNSLTTALQSRADFLFCAGIAF